MKNIENYGVLEMNFQEMQEVEGGIAPLLAYGLWLGAGIAVGMLLSL